jgi:hypothetical protein
MIRQIITGLALAATLAAAAQDSAFSQVPDDAGAVQDSAYGQFLEDAGKAFHSALRVLDEGVTEGGRAIDQTLVVPSQPSFGALASAIIRTPVLDSDGKVVAEVADLVVVPDGRVALVVLRVGGMLGVGGTLKAADFAALETTQHDGRPAYRHRGELAALPAYRIAGED